MATKVLLPQPGVATNAFVATSPRNRTASRDCSGRCHLPFGAARTASSPRGRGIVRHRENRTGRLLPSVWQQNVLLPHLPKKRLPGAGRDLRPKKIANTPCTLQGFRNLLVFFGMWQQTRLLPPLREIVWSSLKRKRRGGNKTFVATSPRNRTEVT